MATNSKAPNVSPPTLPDISSMKGHFTLSPSSAPSLLNSNFPQGFLGGMSQENMFHMHMTTVTGSPPRLVQMNFSPGQSMSPVINQQGGKEGSVLPSWSNTMQSFGNGNPPVFMPPSLGPNSKGDESKPSNEQSMLMSQEREIRDEIRRRRKRELNRRAASKCRQKKVERENSLRARVNELTAERELLHAEIERLRYQLRVVAADSAASLPSPPSPTRTESDGDEYLSALRRAPSEPIHFPLR